MLQNIKTRFIRYIVPPISEFEFIFFVSLISCVSLLGIVSHASLITKLVTDQPDVLLSAILLYGTLSVLLLLILGAFIKMAIEAYRVKQPLWDTATRARYVSIPSYILMLLGILNTLIIGFSDGNSFTTVDIISIVLILRYFLLAMTLDFARYTNSLDELIGKSFEDYQISKRETIAALLLGILGAAVVFVTDNWLAWILITHSIGQILISEYRRYTSNAADHNR